MIDFYSLVNHIYLSIGESSYLHGVIHVNKSSLIPINIHTYKYHFAIKPLKMLFLKHEHLDKISP